MPRIRAYVAALRASASDLRVAGEAAVETLPEVLALVLRADETGCGSCRVASRPRGRRCTITATEFPLLLLLCPLLVSASHIGVGRESWFATWGLVSAGGGNGCWLLLLLGAWRGARATRTG